MILSMPPLAHFLMVRSVIRSVLPTIYEVNLLALDNATVDDALQRLQLPDLNARLSGMAVRLLPHQVLGVAWMVSSRTFFLLRAVLTRFLHLA